MPDGDIIRFDLPPRVVLRAQRYTNSDLPWSEFVFEAVSGRTIHIYVPTHAPTQAEIDEISQFLRVWVED